MLHGADYYPEQWAATPEIWDEDMRLMRLAGCNVMSVGVFAWAALEPAEGQFEFGWLDAITLPDFEHIEPANTTLSAMMLDWVSVKDMPTIQYLGRAAKEMQQSIDADLARMQKLIAAGELYEASTFLPGLAGVTPADDQRLLALQKSLADVKAPKASKPKKAPSTERQPDWVCLAMESDHPRKSDHGSPRGPVRKVEKPAPNLWKIKTVESMSQAPEGWANPGFDDAAWPETTLPKSWRMYHTALLRTRFSIESKDQFDALRIYSWIQWQQDIEIYLNGALIAKINGGADTPNISQELNASALKHLKDGENTLAISTRHNWRWGSGGLVVYNGGFDFNLDARLKEKGTAE